MELVNALMEVIKAAPDLAIWIIAIIYGFKVAVVGSIYGVIRYVVDGIRDTVRAYHNKPKEVVEFLKIADTCLSGASDSQVRQFFRECRNRAEGSSAITSRFVSDYCRGEDLDYVLSLIEADRKRKWGEQQPQEPKTK